MYQYTASNPLYYMIEFMRLQASPSRIALTAMQQILESSFNPMNHTPYARTVRATMDIMERITRQYPKPEFGIKETSVDGIHYEIEQVTCAAKTFCNLIHFKKQKIKKILPKLLIVAPMAGHHATLLRGTVEALLPYCDVYITDWIDAAQIPLSHGSFNMDDYIDYVIEFLQALGPDIHVMGVCQPTVPVLAAVSIISEDKDKTPPRSMVLIGGPIDARKNPTAVNVFATEHNIDWFQKMLITTVPANYPGFGRKVYPGFLQLAGFISMNWKRHLSSHIDIFKHLMIEDDEAADKQKEFYDEYLSVMDLPAEFYIQTIQEVFHQFSLATGHLVSRGRKVHPSSIKDVALLGIEGEHDDISGLGQTKAALDLCINIPNKKKQYHLQRDVGHYGVFSGSKFRSQVVPVIVEFIEKWGK